MLAGCSGGAPISATPAPPTATPTPTPTQGSPLVPLPSVNFDTLEYRRSNGAGAAQAIGAYQAGASGAGILVAVLDTGVDTTSPEFAGRISPLSRDLHGTRSIADEDGHGTAVAGTLLAARDGSGIHGVAFGATLLALRADRPDSCAATAGCSFDANILALGFDAAAQAGARVINMSLGGSGAPANLRAAATRAALNGAVIVLAAGNDGNAEVDGTAIALQQAAPGAVIVAGAIDEARNIASFSNRAGAAAPYFLTTLGVRVRSFDQTGTPFLYTGTSEATPIIAGAAALLAQAFPGLTAGQLVDILLRSADDLGDPGTDAIYGRGALNISRAFAPIGALAIDKVAVPLTSDPGLLASPLGDGGQATMALAAVPVRDEYGRDYVADVAARLRRQAPGRLAGALIGQDVRAVAGRLGGAELTIMAPGLDGLAWRGDIATGADRQQRPPVLGGQTRLQLSPGEVAVIGAGQSPAAMLDVAGDAPVLPVALVAGRPVDNGARPQAGGAYVRQIGGWTLGTAFGLMTMPGLDPRQRSGAGPAAKQALLRADRWVGFARLGLGLDWLDETGSLLGSQLPEVFGLRGATTTSLLVDAAVPFGAWSFGASARFGHTRADLSGVGLWQQAAPLTGTAASLSLGRTALFDAGDHMTLTIAQPLRASGMIRLATGADAMRLGPDGREIAVEADYLLPFTGGFVRLGGFWRRHPGHVAASAADVGLALRTAVRF